MVLEAAYTVGVRFFRACTCQGCSGFITDCASEIDEWDSRTSWYEKRYTNQQAFTSRPFIHRISTRRVFHLTRFTFHQHPVSKPLAYHPVTMKWWKKEEITFPYSSKHQNTTVHPVWTHRLLSRHDDRLVWPLVHGNDLLQTGGRPNYLNTNWGQSDRCQALSDLIRSGAVPISGGRGRTKVH